MATRLLGALSWNFLFSRLNCHYVSECIDFKDMTNLGNDQQRRLLHSNRCFHRSNCQRRIQQHSTTRRSWELLTSTLNWCSATSRMWTDRFAGNWLFSCTKSVERIYSARIPTAKPEVIVIEKLFGMKQSRRELSSKPNKDRANAELAFPSLLFGISLQFRRW